MAYSGRGLARYCITLGFVSGLLLWGTTFAFAENRYPDREITVVIPFGLGGATDVLFRDIFDTAQIYLDQPVLVVNMPGREAMRGAQYVKNASPDGYTLLGSHQTIDLSYLAGLASFSHADFAPAGASPEELAVLNDALAYALASEPLRHRITHEYGSLIDYRSLSTYRDYLDEQFNELVSLTERVHLGR
ncbi:hypothetical protein ACT3TC_05530 [Halomonas sp. AOP27-A1-41]|uniref:hypothetical protein n=1 Tax=Halomonas sp. AOP27-A1-41 TaxID=3457707 RepID=UPI0040336690